MNLILTPGIYNLDQSIKVMRPDTVVLGLGFPTLIPQNGIVSMTVASDEGDIDLRDHLRRGRRQLSGVTTGRV